MATRLSQLVPARGDRVVFVGQTGSGKTTLARFLLDTRAFVVVLDAKGLLRWPEYQVVTTLKALATATRPRLIYRPHWSVLQDDDELEAFFTWCYLRRHCTVYVDELAAVTHGDQYPPHLGACLTRGRELDVELWTATQRPKRVPQVAFSEAEHCFAFKLKMPQDRARVEEMTGIPQDAIQALPKRVFLYSRQDGDTLGPYTLDLTRREIAAP